MLILMFFFTCPLITPRECARHERQCGRKKGLPCGLFVMRERFQSALCDCESLIDSRCVFVVFHMVHLWYEECEISQDQIAAPCRIC